MKLLVLNHAEVERLLPMRECIEVMAETLAALARGEVYQPLRTVVRPEGAAGLLGLMPAYRSGVGAGAQGDGGSDTADDEGDAKQSDAVNESKQSDAVNEPKRSDAANKIGESGAAFGLKAICVFPGNAARGLDAHQGFVAIFDGATGEPRALLNASAITAIRTAAVSAVATRLLAREDACDLAIVGAGVQARAHLEALACVYEIRRARVAARRVQSARRFADEARAKYAFAVEACATPEEAVRSADLIVTATSARQPVVRREWLAAGAHLNAVGTFSPQSREVDSETVAASSLFVDRRESALSESGDVLIPLREGLIGADHIRAEIGEVLMGALPGRTSRDEITLFKSLGLAAEDLAAAEYVYSHARERGAGTWIEF